MFFRCVDTLVYLCCCCCSLLMETERIFSKFYEFLNILWLVNISESRVSRVVSLKYEILKISQYHHWREERYNIVTFFPLLSSCNIRTYVSNQVKNTATQLNKCQSSRERKQLNFCTMTTFHVDVISLLNLNMTLERCCYEQEQVVVQYACLVTNSFRNITQRIHMN